MTIHYDAIVIGGGHNGLTCAAYLGRAGRRVLVLEAAAEIGGCAITAEFAHGFKVSRGAHVLNLLHPKVLRDMNLVGHGLRFANANMTTVALDPGGRHITLTGALTADASLTAHSQTDAIALAALRTSFVRFAKMIGRFHGTVPPRLGTSSWSDRLGLIKLGWAIRSLGRDNMREFLRVAAINIADALNDELESDLLKGAIGFDAIMGTELGPRSPNSVYTFLHRLAGTINGAPGAIALPEGGMGSVTQAMGAACEAAGVELRTHAQVKKVLVENDQAIGVELESGEVIHAGTVISNADPKTTFLKLLGTEHLDTGFVRRIKNIRSHGTTAKLHLGLDGLPSFTGLERADLAGRLIIAPTLDYIERAFNHCKYGEYSDNPAIEITLPSVSDRTLTSEGTHVLSAIVQYAPYTLKGGWDAAHDRFAETIINTIAAYAPDLKDRIVACELLTPIDIERQFGISGGHWHHAELSLDQLVMMRPVPGAAQYATPMPGLYLCGAGTHPGGGIIGAAGMNAARQVVKHGGKQ